MASANFNTQIVSSINDTTLEYNLDDVIIKDFEGSPEYNYTLDISATPDGVVIESRQNLGTYLIIPSLVEFELSITVSNGDRFDLIKAIATTIVTIEGKLNFTNEITKFFESENYTKKKNNTIQGWSEIISKRISSGDLIDGPVRAR